MGGRACQVVGEARQKEMETYGGRRINTYGAEVLWWWGGVAQWKHSNGNQQDLILNFSFVCVFFFCVCFLFISQASQTFAIELVGHNSASPTLHCILCCPFPGYFVVPETDRDGKIMSIFVVVRDLCPSELQQKKQWRYRCRNRLHWIFLAPS